MPQPPLIVVMGVSGSGKSSVGGLLAARLALPFIDADDLHPITNVDKMSAGIALDDDDRQPWLESVGAAMAAASGTGLVMACSALKRRYRDIISARAPSVVFAELTGSRELLADRLGHREGHFMPETLLRSQLDALEHLGDDERGFTVDVAVAVDDVVDEIIAQLA